MIGLFLRWTRTFLAYCLFLVAAFVAINHRTALYLLRQTAGQFNILTNTVHLDEYMRRGDLNDTVRMNIQLIDSVKRFSVHALGYEPTNNYRRVFDQKGRPVLWVITASERHRLEAYEWTFPVVGTVSYKGFFNKTLAYREYFRLLDEGYDVAIRSVTAWSTLGWFSDPLLSGMLHRSKGSMCNLLFHELFHATYYAPGDVNLNENLANFIAHKATVKFLQHDTVHLQAYLHERRDALAYRNFLQRQYAYLDSGYRQVDPAGAEAFKVAALRGIADSLDALSPDKRLNARRKRSILTFKNAAFVDLEQYESLQDSLEEAFNKFYEGDIKKMVRDLTPQ